MSGLTDDEIRDRLAVAMSSSARGNTFAQWADTILPTIREIANERAAAALRAAAEDVPGLIPSTPDYLHSRAAALRASNGEGA